MSAYRVQVTSERTVTFYVEAEEKDDVLCFLDSNPEWTPGDVPGLIDVVGDELEVDYSVDSEHTVVPLFRITPGLDLVEL